MKTVYRIDKNGFYLEPLEILEGEPIPPDCIEKIPTQGRGFYKHKWDGVDWVEGLPLSEIDQLKVIPLDPIDEIKRKQELMQQAIDDIIFFGGRF